MNGTTVENRMVDSNEQIKNVILMFQYVMTIVGIIVNFATLIILREAGEGFARGYLLLLKSQAFADFMVCTAGTIMMFQPPMWTTGNFIFDNIICYIWHGQFLYWIWVLSSIWNLVMIAYERFLAICYPLKHIDLTTGRVRRLIVLAFGIGIGSNSAALVQVRYSTSQRSCVSEYAIPGKAGEWFFSIYGQYIFVIYWLLPFILFCVLYGKVLATLISRRDNSSFGESRVVNSATTQMTRTAIVVTIIFIFSMSWDVWYYMLGRAGAVSYIKNTLLQLIGLWLSSLNSVSNPFVYFVLLPAYRKATIKLLMPCLHKDAAKKTGKESRGNAA